jgi:xylulokinase
MASSRRKSGLVRTDGDDALILGIDLGTTSTKAVAYDVRGRMVATASVPTITHYPRPLWAYFEPEELWGAVSSAVRGVVDQVGEPARIKSVAVASFAEAGVPVDTNGNPTYNVIAWFDRRTIPQADWLLETIGEQRLFERSGLALQPIFTLCKLLWLKENEPHAWERTRGWLMADSYIAWRLGGAPASDYSQAARTLAFDLQHLKWDSDLVTAAGIDPAVFSPVMPAGTAIGVVDKSGAAATGLVEGTIIGVGGHDHVCGAFAAGVTRHGAVLDSMGTAEALFVALDAPIWDPELGRAGYTQGAHVAAGKYYGFGGLYTSGASVDWIRSITGREDRMALTGAAAAVPPGSNGATFMPHLRLSSPPNIDSKSRAAFLGLTTDIDQATMVRAVYEGIAYEARASIEPLVGFAGSDTLPDFTVIGGSARNELLLQIKASITNRPHHVMAIHEATALGGALLGGLAAGIYRDADDVKATVELQSTTIEPDPAAADFYEDFYQTVYKQLYAALKPLNHAIYDQVVDERAETAE